MLNVPAGLFKPNTYQPAAFSFPAYNTQTPFASVASATVVLAGGFVNKTATRGSRCTGISINGGSYVLGPVTGVNSGDTISITQDAGDENSDITCRVTVGTTQSSLWHVTCFPANPEG